MNEACHTMSNGEILNVEKREYPLFYAVLYGDKVATAKFSKRLSCAIKHLPIRVQFNFEYDSYKAVEKGILQDPTLMLNEEIFIEGLVEAETITELFEKILTKRD